MRGALRTRRCFDRDTGISAHGALQSPVDLRTRRREVPNLHGDRDVTITQEGTWGGTLLWRGPAYTLPKPPHALDIPSRIDYPPGVGPAPMNNIVVSVWGSTVGRLNDPAWVTFGVAQG